MKNTTVSNKIEYFIENSEGYCFFKTERRLKAYEELEYYSEQFNIPLFLKKVTTTIASEVLEVSNEESDGGYRNSN